MTMMNGSGEALRGFEFSTSDLLIVCDDVNLPLGAIRVRPKGGAGGHNGIESCLSVLQTEDVARVRIGVGIEHLPRDLSEFVLSPFESQEQNLIRQTVQRAAEACETWIKDGIEVVMNRYNTKQEY